MNISQLTEKAIKSFLDSAGLTLVTNIYRGVEGSDTQAVSTEETHRRLPCVIADCGAAVPGTIDSGNWYVTANVRVLCNADDKTETQFHAMCQEVFGNFMRTDIAASLSAFAGFTALQVVPRGQNQSRAARHWESSLVLEIYCAPSDIS
jgi:hypothetical protein